jgi:hypothetical protein
LLLHLITPLELLVPVRDKAGAAVVAVAGVLQQHASCAMVADSGKLSAFK